MIDPTSIAGLSLASCDALLKLGERTAQLIHDIRSFNEDTGRLQSKVGNENTRTVLLRHILFEPSPVYGGLTLFERFGEDAQDEIRVSLDKLVYVLEEAQRLLEKHCHPSISSESTTPTSSLLNVSVKSPSIRSRSPSPSSPWRSLPSLPKASLMLLRWSFHDKKRAEDILCDFTTLNGDVHEKIKLLCLASDLGLNLQHRIEHFQRLQSDENSIKLGFSTDATLRLAAPDLQSSSDTLELSSSWEGSLRIAPPARGGFGLIEHEGIKYLLEHRPCELDERAILRLEELARLLAQPKEVSFCMPHCIGWKRIPGVQQVGFVFDIPTGASPRPTSLFRLLDAKNVRLSLGQRFHLSVALSRCISQLQMVKWVHESFRSENILFFPQSDQIQEPTYDYSKPLVLGFESSRPEVDFSSGFADICLERDVYRHPERQGRPGKLFNKTHDIYALGVVLLEIGLWQRAITLERNNFTNARDPYVIKAQLLKQAERRLGDKMGDRYRDVVVKCLTAGFDVKDDTKEDLKLQQAFRVQVLDVLERAAKNV